ncbi:MAG: NAD(P)/FAD-dependent oxidoreductase [Planctomycetes bacterium]|nr:NAD(P)/FAD-dependent oxidoreductase [Planctomycetota bacterium]
MPLALLRRLVAPRRPEPSYPDLPVVSPAGESSRPGVYLAGEVAGTPLIKLGLNQGHALAERLHQELGPPDPTDPDLLDVVIVGAGAAGLGAAMRCHELGMRYVVLDAGRVASTVVNMYKGKVLFAEPAGVPLNSSLWFEECTREQLLARWQEQLHQAGLQVREHTRVSDVRGAPGAFVVVTDRGEHRARRVLLALGKAGNPRKAGVPGEQEHAARVLHHLADPDAFDGRRVFVYGGGDVAAEAALALCKRNRVTMVTVDPALTFPRKRNVDALLAEQAAGRLELHLGSRLARIEPDAVTFVDAGGQERTVQNDVVFEMIGAELPLPLFRRVGVRLERDWPLGRFLALALVALLVYSLYALKKYPEAPYSWPFDRLIAPATYDAVLRPTFEVAFAPFAWLFDPEAYAVLRRTRWFQQGYLYSGLYTVLMCVFGALALRRWSAVAADPRYQRWRYATLIGFQVAFFLVANVIAVQALSIQHAWRAWGLYQPWPLFFNTFHWWDASDPRAVVGAFVGAGLLLTFVAIPLAARRHGKRFCTWICGCGGLAETLGDRWRHLAAKGARSRAWEFQGAVVLAAAAIVTVVTVGAFGTRGDNAWASAYSYVVDFWLVAVIPIALYRLLRRQGVVPLLVPPGGLEPGALRLVRPAAHRLERPVHLLHALQPALPGGGRRDVLRQGPAAVRQLQHGLHPVRDLHRRVPHGRPLLRAGRAPGRAAPAGRQPRGQGVGSSRARGAAPPGLPPPGVRLVLPPAGPEPGPGRQPRARLHPGRRDRRGAGGEPGGPARARARGARVLPRALVTVLPPAARRAARPPS